MVRDERGRAVGFGGRALSPEGEPKYLNSPESPVFSKKRLLYGLFQAREAIRRRDRVVLVEGYFDHLALLRSGIEETVASMGTALTPEQVERLRRLTDSAVLCYDGDTAGRNATRGALTLLLAQGFGARVARLPQGEDPDDLLRHAGAEAVAARIDEAPDYLTWLLEDVRPDAPDLSSSDKRERVGRILDILGAIPDRILRYEEYRKVAAAVSVPVDVLWGNSKANLQAPIARSIDVGTAGNASALSAVAPPAVEKQLLQALLAGGEHNSLILSTLNADFLTDGRVRQVVSALRTASSGAEVVDFQRQIADLTEEERSFISGFALEESEPTEKGVEELLKRLESNYLERESAEIQRAIDRAGEGSEDLAGLMRRKQDVMRRKAALGRAPRWKGNELGD